MKKRRFKKMHVILGILILLIMILTGIIGRYFYKNLHPVDDRYLRNAIQAGFTEKTAMPADGSVINYSEGPNNGPPLLLIHGQGMAWEDYAAVLPGLSNKFHVFAVDCYGHGESSHEDALYSCEANGNALIWFMQNIIGEKCYVSGHSSGGIMAAWLAANAPAHVNGVVLEDPPLFNVTPDEMREGASCFAWLDSFVIIHNFLNQKEETDYLVYYYKNSYFTSLFGGLKDTIARSAEAFRKENPGQPMKIFWAPYAWLRGMSYIDLYDLKFGEAFYNGSWLNGVSQEDILSEIKCPVIYLKAETVYGKDGVLYAANSDEDAERVRDHTTGCETVTIKSGHDIHYEHPDFFISACEKLLDI